MMQYVDWSPSAPSRDGRYPIPDRRGGGDPAPGRIQGADGEYEKARHALFWSDSGCRGMYRGHVYAMTHRRNTFSGWVSTQTTGGDRHA